MQADQERPAGPEPGALPHAPPLPLPHPPPPPPLPHAPPLPRPPPLPLAADPAFTGPIGEYARLAGSLTEADPFAVLVTALTGAATMIGPGPYVRTGDTVHPPVLFALLIAETPKANRGMSWRLARQLLDAAAPGGAAGSVVQGLSGDSGLIGALGLRGRPAARRALPRGARSVLVHEPAFARVLTVSRRASSPIPWLLRNAWDGAPLDPIRYPALRHHVGVVAHMTAEQLRAQVSLTDTSASFLGRFLFVRVRRSAPVLDEGGMPPAVISRLAGLLAPRLAAASQAGRLSRDRDTLALWSAKYDEIAADDPGGLLGICTARAARLVTRLSLVYALTDGDTQIRRSHVEAALSLWRYCRQSASWALGDRSGESLEQRLLEVITRAGRRGLSLSEQSAAFSRNIAAAQIAAARQLLEERQLVETVAQPRAGPGRPARITRLRS